jgi:hypothetical protein
VREGRESWGGDPSSRIIPDHPKSQEYASPVGSSGRDFGVFLEVKGVVNWVQIPEVLQVFLQKDRILPGLYPLLARMARNPASFLAMEG